MRESSVKTPERRQAPRTKLVEIAYIGMGPENGGLVLDVSDGGLSFHSVAPVAPAESIHFLLSLRGHSRIEGAGEVVWTNAMRTVCGLRFTSLSAGAREYLNNWTNQSRMAQSARKLTVAPASRPKTQSDDTTVSLANQPDKETESAVTIPFSAETVSSQISVRPLWRDPLVFWIAFGILGTVLAVTAFIYGVRVGKSEIGSAAHSAPAAASALNPQATEDAAAPGSSSATETTPEPIAVPAVPADAPSVQAEASPVPHETNSHPVGTLVNAAKADGIPAASYQRSGDAEIESKAPDQHDEVASEAGKSELAAALASLRGTNGVRDSSKAARLLWAAVQNHNSTAEVILADLYLRGDGVDKSCEQGRVLLIAASKSGNAQGQQKLAELDANGCP